MEKLGIIYCYKNKVNGKCYVGQTVNPALRMIQHISASSSCPAFHGAIEKYGIDNFEYSVLHTEKTKEEMDSLERVEIERHNSLVPFGYNIKDCSTREYKEYDEMTYSEKIAEVALSMPVEIIGTGMVYLNAREAAEDTGDQEKDIKHDVLLDWYETNRRCENHWRYANEVDSNIIKKHAIDDIQIEYKDIGNCI